MLLKNFSGLHLEAATDEAGRGCIAGPVTAAAVILPPDFENELINDSKKITNKLRYTLRDIIIDSAITYKVTHIDEHTIESINILHASIKAMQDSVMALQPFPEFLIIDGNRFTAIENLAHQCIIKGDMKYLNIAAASILAKTARDDYMDMIHEEFPMYNWKQNKGYPTKQHREAIKEFGPCKYHRNGFKLLADQLSLDF